MNTIKRLIKGHPLTAKIARTWLDNQYRWQTPRSTGHGFNLVGSSFMIDGVFEATEVAVCKELLSKHDVFINIGANIGYYTCLALTQKKKTIAIEPIFSNVNCLLRNIEINGFQDQVEVFPLAIGNKPGLMEIYGGGTVASLIKGWSGTPSTFKKWIPVTTFDDLLTHRFTHEKCLIWIDVEGAELYLLQGAKEFLEHANHTTWVVEISIDEHLPEGQRINPNLKPTFEIFWSAGYTCYTANEERKLITPETIEAIVKDSVNTLHTHNFIFTKDSI